MNSPLTLAGAFARTAVLFSLVVFSAGLKAAGATAPAPSGSAPEKTHTLFIGTDISIEQNNKLYRIQDVSGASFIISVDGTKTSVPMRGERHEMKVQQSLKLTNVSASLTGLAAVRAYTPGSDPRMRRQIEASRVSNAIGDNASLAMGKYISAENKGGAAINPEVSAISAANLDAATAQLAKEAFAAEKVDDVQFSSDFANTGLARVRAESDLAEGLYDAVEVNFEVSAPSELKSPYVVLVVRYHSMGKPGTSRDMIYARALEGIGSSPTKVHILQGGLPRGYELESYQVHLYSLGEEVATDVVPKRVPLTREEAFEYVKAEYVGTHKGATLPASPAMGKLGVETKARLTGPQLSGVYFVKVTKEGKPVDAYTDEACSQPVDGVIDSLVKSVRFFPALENGKRVEGLARLVFSQLTK